MSRGFDHVETWVFDLDNTLYPASCRLFDQIHARMQDYISRLFGLTNAEAKVIQKRLFEKYGTTLSGLVEEHAIEPGGFLDHVHDLDYSPVAPDPVLDRALARLPGRKLIFTSGTVGHAERVLARLGVAHHFSDIFDIVLSDYVSKPAAGPYRSFVARNGIDPGASAFFDDIARNLAAPHDLGMTTVLVSSAHSYDTHDAATAGERPHFVHHVTDDLAGFLSRVR
jgi:putative hydrolase of the HAD superfamily